MNPPPTAHPTTTNAATTTNAVGRPAPTGAPAGACLLTGKQMPLGLVVLLVRFHAGAAPPQGTWGLTRIGVR